jgi:hypothetical protein
MANNNSKVVIRIVKCVVCGDNLTAPVGSPEIHLECCAYRLIRDILK